MCVEIVRNDRDERAVRLAGSASGVPRWSDRALKPVYQWRPSDRVSAAMYRKADDRIGIRDDNVRLPPIAVRSSSIMATGRPVAAGVILVSLKKPREQIIHFSHVVFTMEVIVVN